jgi:hypothetical protein
MISKNIIWANMAKNHNIKFIILIMFLFLRLNSLYANDGLCVCTRSYNNIYSCQGCDGYPPTLPSPNCTRVRECLYGDVGAVCLFQCPESQSPISSSSPSPSTQNTPPPAISGSPSPEPSCVPNEAEQRNSYTDASILKFNITDPTIPNTAEVKFELLNTELPASNYLALSFTSNATNFSSGYPSYTVTGSIVNQLDSIIPNSEQLVADLVAGFYQSASAPYLLSFGSEWPSMFLAKSFWRVSFTVNNQIVSSIIPAWTENSIEFDTVASVGDMTIPALHSAEVCGGTPTTTPTPPVVNPTSNVSPSSQPPRLVQSPVPSSSQSASQSPSATRSPAVSPSASPSASTPPNLVSSPSSSPSKTPTPSISATSSVPPSMSPSNTPSSTPTTSASQSPSVSATSSVSPSKSSSASPSPSSSPFVPECDKVYVRVTIDDVETDNLNENAVVLADGNDTTIPENQWFEFNVDDPENSNTLPYLLIKRVGSKNKLHVIAESTVDSGSAEVKAVIEFMNARILNLEENSYEKEDTNYLNDETSFVIKNYFPDRDETIANILAINNCNTATPSSTPTMSASSTPQASASSTPRPTESQSPTASASSSPKDNGNGPGGTPEPTPFDPNGCTDKESTLESRAFADHAAKMATRAIGQYATALAKILKGADRSSEALSYRKLDKELRNEGVKAWTFIHSGALALSLYTCIDSTTLCQMVDSKEGLVKLNNFYKNFKNSRKRIRLRASKLNAEQITSLDRPRLESLKRLRTFEKAIQKLRKELDRPLCSNLERDDELRIM